MRGRERADDCRRAGDILDREGRVFVDAGHSGEHAGGVTASYFEVGTGAAMG